MFAFKVFQMLLLPSFFVLFLIILGLVFLKIKKWAGLILIIIGAVFYYLFSITPFANLVIAPLENQYRSQDLSESAHQEVKYIVLLIGGVKDGELPISSKLAESSLFRAIR